MRRDVGLLAALMLFAGGATIGFLLALWAWAICG